MVAPLFWSMETPTQAILSSNGFHKKAFHIHSHMLSLVSSLFLSLFSFTLVPRTSMRTDLCG